MDVCCDVFGGEIVALITTITDYDSWRPNSEVVTTAEVLETLKANAEMSRHVAATKFQESHKATL